MTKNNLYALLVSALLAACTGSADYLITGNSKDFADGKRAYLFYFDANDEPLFMDSTVCENNSFVFRGVVDTMRAAVVAVANSQTDEDGMAVDLILEPGEISIAEFDAEKSHFHVATGTPLMMFSTGSAAK